MPAGGGSQQHAADIQGAKSPEFLKSLTHFFQRDLISIPIINRQWHSSSQKPASRLRSASLELDTSAYPSIEYIAGNRLSVYPRNPVDHVNAILKHLVDDLQPLQSASPSIHRSAVLNRAQSSDANLHVTRAAVIGAANKLSPPWFKFIQLNGKRSLRLALLYLYDIMTPPSRDLLRIMADCCSNKTHRASLVAISRTDDTWAQWVCAGLRSLSSTLEEFNSCRMSARVLFSELTLQQPRQYSISSIKSNKRFRTQIIVVQHRFSAKQIALSLQNAKESQRLDQEPPTPVGAPVNVRLSGHNTLRTHPTIVHVNHADSNASPKSSSSARSIRSVVAYSTSPISTQQVRGVPTFSGPLMSLYAAASLADSGLSSGSDSSTSRLELKRRSVISLNEHSGSQSNETSYEGLCSSYLLNVEPNEPIICEFVENPRFTLKGNRERPVLMIGQDVGVLAYRAFWQQRTLEHERAQMFYTLFKDLPPKKFGDMQLVCLTGSRCRLEALFRHEIQTSLTNKILSSVTYINRKLLANLLEHAATASSGTVQSAIQQQANKRRKLAAKKGVVNMKLQIDSKELNELGDKIFKLLVENNGCLYTCCDAQMTQAIEILLVESIVRHSAGKLTRETIMTTLMPKWKGRGSPGATFIGASGAATGASNNNQHQQIGTSLSPTSPIATNNNGHQFLFTLENPFERAQIVEEIYDSSI